MRRFVRASALLLLASSSLAALACTSPPEREMLQARSELERARAAGAEQYAPDDFREATSALRRSEEAVDQHDYRSALSFALDSRERAAAAATAAADQKARVRAETEQTLVSIQALQSQLRDRIKVADAARLPRPQRESVSDARRSIVVANVAVQKAGEALSRQDYLAARQAIRDVPESLTREIASLDAAIASVAPRRRH